MTLTEKFNLVTIDGPRADRLLEHINLERWGRGGPLLRMVAYWSTWPQWTPIRAADIAAAHGRTMREARYDLEVMHRLAAQRVLECVPGRPSLWRVNRDLRRWVGVPGIPSWRRVVDLFLATDVDNCARLRTETAGQSATRSPVRPSDWGPSRHLLSANDAATAARDMAPSARRPGKTHAQTGRQRAVSATPHYSPVITPSSYVDDDDGRRLVKAVREAIGASAIYGQPAEMIARLAVDHRGRLPRLEELAAELLIGCRAPSRAAAVLAQAVEDGALDLPASGGGLDPVEAKRRSIEAQIAAWERAGAEPEDIDRLRSELEDLGGA